MGTLLLCLLAFAGSACLDWLSCVTVLALLEHKRCKAVIYTGLTQALGCASVYLFVQCWWLGLPTVAGHCLGTWLALSLHPKERPG